MTGAAARARVAYLLGPGRLEWREVEVPVAGSGEVLLRVGAAVTCGTDLKVYRQGGHARMLRPPSPFGHEVAGTIAALGADVAGWAIGDRVAVANSAPCGSCAPCSAGRENLCRDLRYLNGAFADWLLVPARFVARSLHRLPDSLPFAVAALAEPLACVLHGSDSWTLPAGATVLVLGAGPIGLLWTGVLAHRRHPVVLADPNPSRLGVGEQLGATRVLTVERGSAVETLLAAAPDGAAGFAAAIDCTASPEGFAACIATLAPGGAICAFAGPPAGSTHGLDLHRLHYSELEVRGAYHYRPRDYAAALEQLASGRLRAELLLSATLPLDRLEHALELMGSRQALKVALVP